jgi:hypothetical protein
MTEEDQLAEVKRLNKGTKKGLKGAIKTKLLDVNFKIFVMEKMRSYLSSSRLPLPSMYHAAPTTINVVMSNPNFISVGEWVEVDVDRTPGRDSSDH